jgi:hypothetical protein
VSGEFDAGDPQLLKGVRHECAQEPGDVVNRLGEGHAPISELVHDNVENVGGGPPCALL